jgi:hypothetical protein
VDEATNPMSGLTFVVPLVSPAFHSAGGEPVTRRFHLWTGRARALPRPPLIPRSGGVFAPQGGAGHRHRFMAFSSVISAVTWSYTSWRSRSSSSTLSTAWMIVVWSLPPNSRAMLG